MLGLERGTVPGTTLQQQGLTFPDDTSARTAGNIRVDVDQYRAFVGETAVVLTYQEFELLQLLVARRNRILSFDEIAARLWNAPAKGTRQRLGVVICRLRAKLRGASPYQIRTVRSRGYGLTTNAYETEVGEGPE